MRRSKAKAQPGALVLADIPERNRLRELQQLLNELRDQIAELDLEIETLRDMLVAFESMYQARLQLEHHQLSRIERLVQHMERWAELLRDEELTRRFVQQAKRIETRRVRELADQAKRSGGDGDGDAQAQAAQVELESSSRSKDERLKAAYRALARRYHPDLARTEEERLRCSDLMGRINALYHAGDLARLEQLVEQAKGGEVESLDVELLEQIAQLEERLRWFRQVLQNLHDERAAIERSPTCELMRNVQQATENGRDLIAEIKKELQERVEKSYSHIDSAAYMLEAEVSQYNRRKAAEDALAPTPKGKRELEVKFDPFADKRLVRLGLEQLRDLQASPEAHRLADALEEQLAGQVAALRLVLLTYVAELSPFPLPGLESYDDISLRFDHLGRHDEAPLTFAKALVEADSLVEYGVRRASEKVVHMGLRFRNELLREAVPLMLRSPPMRREFKGVLGVLGEREECSSCKRDIFTVPLFRTRGLDDLRALVCPACGAILRSYWMPKGKDVQAVLNAAFLDFEIVTEWSFQLGRGSIGMQLLPLQVDGMKVGDLKKRFHEDVFERNELTVELGQLRLVQDGAPVKESTPLSEIIGSVFVVRFTPAAKTTEAEALEMLRYRVRTRFKSDE